MPARPPQPPPQYPSLPSSLPPDPNLMGRAEVTQALDAAAEGRERRWRRREPSADLATRLPLQRTRHSFQHITLGRTVGSRIASFLPSFLSSASALSYVRRTRVATLSALFGRSLIRFKVAPFAPSRAAKATSTLRRTFVGRDLYLASSEASTVPDLRRGKEREEEMRVEGESERGEKEHEKVMS